MPAYVGCVISGFIKNYSKWVPGVQGSLRDAFVLIRAPTCFTALRNEVTVHHIRQLIVKTSLKVQPTLIMLSWMKFVMWRSEPACSAHTPPSLCEMNWTSEWIPRRITDAHSKFLFILSKSQLNFLLHALYSCTCVEIQSTTLPSCCPSNTSL